ncbi:HtaA domain-containing protein [Salinibacterium sp. SWN1162]|uniref:HtaA domain-containing protein n=1 Tax=Salinibacterium sp. SWN1162 TaxID=2792053 RepID=UPI0018CED817|nr:HtaA domain-containing protein [Salinibacterium sp. SWN1162]MBH0008658.1 HtaA domain-containing protein [Salinibacterium sp. SWN1162]
MRRLNVCLLGPAALVVTAVAIALTPMTSNAAVPDAAGASLAHANIAPADATLAADSAVCDVSDAAITWGVKESLRSYISGTIAHGEWAVGDGATYETPNFGWAAGSGELDAGEGTIAFDGTLRFTGHDGILDTTLSGLEIVFDSTPTAVLIFDVSGTTQDGLPVDAVDVKFATIDVSAISVDDGTAVLDSAPVTLTDAGSAAFGTYPAGEEFDPITVSFSATPECMPEPRATYPVVARNLMVLASVVVIVGGVSVVFFVSRRRGTARTLEPTKDSSDS